MNSMKKNVLFILPSDLMGGAEFNLLKCARLLSAMPDFTVTVVFLSKRENGKSRWHDLSNVNFIYMTAEREFFGAIKFLYHSLFKMKSEYDFCFTSHTHCNAYASLLTSLKVIKVNKLIVRESTNVFSWFTGLKKRFVTLFYFCYAKNATVICQTKRMKSELLSNVPSFKHRDVRVLMNPVEVSQIKDAALEIKSADLGFNHNQVNIVAVGRLVEEKAYDILLDSVARLSFDFHLYIVGTGHLESSLKEQAARLNISKKVFFVGHAPNPFPYIKNADVCVLPSRLEGFPNVLLEMMTLSNCVISTLCADGIEDIPGIFTCEINSSSDLKLKIDEALACDKSELLNRQEEMELYVQKLDISNFVNKIIN
ncbi:MAG: glycosyltransferase involved in cell wall biosynthesis [Pseudoalteromonas distincta]|jgi:glycosyltransferase involved in cell wall biosynthesis